MNQIRITGINLSLINNKPIASLKTIYGVGKIKANKLSGLLLNNPKLKTFRANLVDLSQELNTQRIFKAMTADNKLKLLLYANLERLARIGCYKAHRILQNLPSNGQRTHTNAGTPNRLNPFVKLGLKASLTQELMTNNKKWELLHNGRSQDISDLVVKGTKKYSKAASLAKKKKNSQKKDKVKKK